VDWVVRRLDAPDIGVSRSSLNVELKAFLLDLNLDLQFASPQAVFRYRMSTIASKFKIPEEIWL
jgi:hypothetical protein